METAAMHGGVPTGPSAEPVGPSAPDLDAFSVLNAIPGVVAVIGGDGVVRWINESMTSLTGYTVEDLVGSNMLDHLDLEWNPLSLESISFALDNPGMRLPTMMRFHTKLGPPVVMEVTANNQLDNPQIQGLVVHLRPSDERVLVDLILESFASGDDLDRTIGRLHDAARAETLESESAMFLLFSGDDVPGAALASSPVVSSLSAVRGLDAPWDRAALSGRPVLLADVDELPVALRGVAADAGFRACWAYPVCRTGTGVVDAVLVLWRREPGVPEPSATMMADRLVRISALVLERVEHSRDLQHAATHDALTGLVNRARFFATVDQHVADAAGPLGVLYLDLDGFKPINDRWGHGHGDQVLRTVADRLRSAARSCDTVARLGGDEFAVACPGAGADELATVAERILAVLRAPISVDGDALRVGASIGMSTCSHGSRSRQDLIAAADSALIATKATAKGTWRLGPSST